MISPTIMIKGVWGFGEVTISYYEIMSKLIGKRLFWSEKKVVFFLLFSIKKSTTKASVQCS